MVELHIKPMEADSEGWVEVCLVTQSMDREGTRYVAAFGGEPEGMTIGHVRVVDGTAGEPNEWWDARAFEEHGRVSVRRFTNLEAALLGLATRLHLPADARRIVGW